MKTVLMKQASNFLQEKYKATKLAFSEVSETALLVENATDDNPWCPDTKTMTQIAEASYDFDDYWRIVDLLHKRLYEVNWKKWRQSYNTLILLEFLITHGPEDFAREFKCDANFIRELGTFHHIDNTGVNWGLYMKHKTERILILVEGGAPLKEMRSKAIKLTNEIQGFGNSPSSSSLSSSSSPSSQDSWRSSFDSYSSTSPTWNNNKDDATTNNEVKQISPHHNNEQYYLKNSPRLLGFDDQHNNKMPKNLISDGIIISDMLDWNSIQDTFTDINLNDDYENHDNNNKKKMGVFQGIYSKHFGYSLLNNDGKDKNT